ncbi:cytosolic carboxypeptidase 1-like [Liolophura sinensis]|uniref:cytosolic carboxypeptidase 1-like n=1 Tax=Liolophura sinensis TaxID=3198878 RepID=UPI0031592D16
MEKSSLSARLGNHFMLMEKLNGRFSKKQCPDDLNQLRYLCSKIHHLLDAQDTLNREIILKHASYLDQLLGLIETYTDPPLTQTVLHILIDLIGKNQSGKRVSRLVSHGASNILFQLLTREWKETSPNENTLLLCHQVLAKMGMKDKKFGLKARLNQSLGVTMGMLKNNCSNFRVLQSIIPVIKHYSANSVNASYLGKQNVIPYLFKVASSCSRKQTTVLKHALNTLVNLTKSKSNSARTIGQEGVKVLVSWHLEWHQYDSRHRHIPLRKAILNILKNVTNLKSGRKAFVETDGITVLYDSCLELEDNKEMESVVLIASQILRKCCPKNKLPLSSISSPVTCDLPASDYYNLDACQSLLSCNRACDKPAGYSSSECGVSSVVGCGSQTTPDADSDRSSLDDDDDIDSDEDRSKPEKQEPAEDEADETDPEPLYRRSPDDVQGYHMFFPELMDFQIVDESSSTPESAIVIPTALSEGVSVDIHLQSRNRQSHWSDSSSSSQASTTVAANSEEFDSESYLPSVGSAGSELSDSYLSLASTTAVNLKTGTTVLHIDWSMARKLHSWTSTSSPGVVKFPKLGKALKRSPNTKEKRGKKSLPEPSWYMGPDFLEALSITQVPGPFLNNPESAERLGQGVDSPTRLHDPEVYAVLAQETRSVLPFNKLAYPDLHGCLPFPAKEPLYHRKVGIQRKKIFEDIDRMIHASSLLDKVVYDLDELLNVPSESTANSYLSNDDEDRIGKPANDSSSLCFNSQFECGNLRKVIQVRESEYDLILNPDPNTNHHHQWFYFEVSNMVAGVPYRFNIINCEKLNSQFNFGMKPLVYSVTEAVAGRPHWVRKGSEICYYRNHFVRSSSATGGLKGKAYYTATFTITFEHDYDVCYLAYHYPYTYTSLKTHIARWESMYDKNQIYYHRETLCETIGGNPVPVLTITSLPHSWDREGIEEFRQRPFVFLSSRVHPGESNSSWVMKGTIDYLFSDKPQAKAARDLFIFKIVPMLNPDGVINGCHRCSLTAEDLNRRWLFPCPKLHPTIFHTKGLLLYMALINRVPLVFCDYHGHSRRKNVFLYGCNPLESWIPDDQNNPASSSASPSARSDSTSCKTLPRILHSIAPAFSLPNSSYLVEKGKESTARVVVWRQIGVVRSYTMESSYCGCDQGQYKDLHISTNMLEEMGRKFCDGLVRLGRSRSVMESAFSEQQTPLAIPDTGSSTYDNPSVYPGVQDGADGLSESEEDSEDEDSEDSEQDEEEGMPDEGDDDVIF